MRILVTIVHWNPMLVAMPFVLSVSSSIRPSGSVAGIAPFDTRQGMLNIATKTVDDANHALRHQFTIKVVTDGQHHVSIT